MLSGHAARGGKLRETALSYIIHIPALTHNRIFIRNEVRLAVGSAHRDQEASLGRHSGRDLVLPASAKYALAAMAAAGLVRTLPELGIGAGLAGLHYTLAAMLWSAAFVIWLVGFWPILNAGKGEDSGCG